MKFVTYTDLLFIVILIVVAWLLLDGREGFHGEGWGMKYCSDCGWLSRGECSDCINCGYCISPSGRGECVPGDENGPYFRSDCIDYRYKNPYVQDYLYGFVPYFLNRYRYGYGHGRRHGRRHGRKWRRKYQ